MHQDWPQRVRIRSGLLRAGISQRHGFPQNGVTNQRSRSPKSAEKTEHFLALFATSFFMTKRLLPTLFLAAVTAAAAGSGGRVQCVGGTLPAFPAGTKGTIQTTDRSALVLVAATATARIPFQKINLIEYGQDVGRRVVLAVLISPIFLLSKARAHYITLGYTDDTGRQQVIVLRVDKRSVKTTLAMLEARTGRAVRFKDEEARKSLHG
jgi:hypothetical protein